eukprot:TRINITY_DN41865_c0_g1_i1.p1 TRINITY_DN41865_c0_g1~~TRINITY_DN41865_c0_g1_i1.p1  ORF type:complete len:513 (-),score=116.02 TRINITY_DN41865_c0_g1_i1:64-1443(-)
MDSTVEGSLDALDRPAKRMSAARSILGGAGRSNRTSRPRSCIEPVQHPKGAENAPVATMQHTCSAPTSVLGDVTNTAGHQWPAQYHRSTPSDAPPGGKLNNLKETGISKLSSQSPCSPSEVEMDPVLAEDPQYVADYVSDIYKHLHQEEVLMRPAPDYMDRQMQVNAKMRAILVDWLVDVHKRYKLRPETLFLAITLVDRFLESRVTARKYLQLVGVTALMVAAKFEELYPPQIKDFVYVTDQTYTPEEVIKMEVLMLTALDFNICRPTAVHFLERYQRVNSCTEAHKDLSQYLLELTLVDYKMVKYTPSHLAAAAILLSNKLLKRQPSWSPAAAKYTKMAEQSLKECAKEMCGLLEQAEVSPLQAVRKKFSQPKHHAVAKLNFTGHPPAAQSSSQVATPSLLPPPVASQTPSDGRATNAAAVGRRASAPSLRPRASLGAPVPMTMDDQASSAAAEGRE